MPILFRDGRDAQGDRAPGSHPAPARRRPPRPAALPLAADADPAGDRRAARDQLRDRRPVRAGRREAGARPLQPDVPRAGARQERRAHLDDGGDGRGQVQEGGQVRQGGPVDRVRDRDPRVRQRRAAVEGARGRRGRHRGGARQPGPRLPAQPHPRLRPGHPAGRAVRLPGAAGERRRGDGGARQLHALAGAPGRGPRDEDHVRRRGRDRRGEGGADGDRRLPQEPGPLPGARRPHPEGRPALRPSGHGQDTARAGGRGRGRRAVLLDLGVGVRRGDRRRRRLAGARPLQAGEGVRARGSSSSTSSTRSAGRAPRERTSAATTSASRRSTRSSRRWTASRPTRP